jgi:hypothetical protein
MKFINTLIFILILASCQTKTEQSNNVTYAPVIVQNDTIPLFNNNPKLIYKSVYGVDWWWRETKYNFNPKVYSTNNQLFRTWIDSTNRKGSLTFRIQQKVNSNWENVYEWDNWGGYNSYNLTDWNKDSFKDVIIGTKWESAAILYNPKLKNYVSIGNIGDTVIQINNERNIYFSIAHFKDFVEGTSSKTYESWSSDLFSLDDLFKKKIIAQARMGIDDSLQIYITKSKNDTFDIINPRKLKEYFEEDNNSISFDSQSFLKKYWADNWAKF